MVRTLILGTSIPSHHLADDTSWDHAQFDIGSDVKINIDDMFQIFGVTGDAMDEFAGHYRQQRDHIDIPGSSSSVSVQYGSAPSSYYHTPPPSHHQYGYAPSSYYQTPPPPPQPPLSRSV
ncbi:hypothetical protein S83_010584 [Arachis hypogaea]